MAPASRKSMIGVGLLVFGIGAAAYPIVIAPLLNPAARDEIRDPRLEAGFQKKSMWREIDRQAKSQ